MSKHLKRLIMEFVSRSDSKKAVLLFGVGRGSDMLFDAVKMFNSSNTQLFSKQQLAIRTIKNYDTGNDANIRDLIEI
jgi:hypothetical protein